MTWTPPASAASCVEDCGSLNHEVGVIMKITRVGLDLAKRVFQVHGVDEQGRRLSKTAI